MGVKVYGQSDDLIEIDGDIYDEFGYGYNESYKYLAFSDGTVIRIRYGEDGGYWRLRTMAAGSGTIKHRPATSEQHDYSDVIEIEDVDIKWVVIGDIFEMAMYPADEEGG